MKMIMITATLIISLISVGFSQDRRHSMRLKQQERMVKSPEERAKMSADALAKRLNLNDKQKQEVYELNLERAKKMEKLQGVEKEFRKNQMEKHQALMENSDKKLNKILTDEQRKTYQELRAQQRDRMKTHRGQRERPRVN